MKPISVGLLGIGVVGGGTWDVLNRNADEIQRRAGRATPAGRPGKPEEIGAVALFLASEGASYLTGQCIYPDGGRLALNYTVPVPD